VVKPVKRENSNTTNATGVTAATATTNASGQNKNKAFSQIKTSLTRQEIIQLVEAWYLQELQAQWLKAARVADLDLFKPREEDLPIIIPRCKMLI
jgi:hypothetical protein